MRLPGAVLGYSVMNACCPDRCRRRAPLIVQALAPLCCVFFLPALVVSQEAGYKSIHALESESHGALQVAPVLRPGFSQRLSPSAPSNLTRTVFGYYPYWASGYSQIRFQDLTHLAVFSVEADGSGRLVNLRGWPNTPLIAAAHQANVRVVLVCTLFESGQLAQLLASSAARESLIANLREQVLIGGADGINIDFEGVPASQKATMVVFMRGLAAAIRTAIPGAHISMATPAVDWSGAWDYPSLADICDALLIMAYDYHWSGSPNAGPVSPLNGSDLWGPYGIRWTLADYLGKVGAAHSYRLILGLPYYGYDWPAQGEALNAKVISGSVQSKTYAVAAAEAESFGRRWDDFSSTPWYYYVSTTPHQVWYDDAGSLSLKYDLVFQNNLQGIGIWALTYDRGRTELWNLIEDRFLAPTTPDPPEVTAPATFFDTVGLPVALKERGSVPASDFEVAVGTTSGGTEVSGFISVGLRHQVLVRNLNLTSGSTYYVTARSIGADGRPGPSSVPVPISIDTAQVPSHKYLPHWISSSSLYTGFAAVNSTSATLALWIRGHVAGRSSVIEASWVLKPGEQLAQVIPQADLLGSGAADAQGWLDVLYLSGGFQGMYLVGDTAAASSLAGSPLLDSQSRQVLPELDGNRAAITVVNPGHDAANIQISLSQADGTVLKKTAVLGPGELLTTTVPELFPQALSTAPSATSSVAPARASFITLESDLPVVSTSLLQRSGDSTVVPALAAASAFKSGAFSYVLMGCNYQSQIALVNPENEPQIATLRFFGSVRPDPITIQIEPRSAISADAMTLLGLGGSSSSGGCITGAMTVAVSQGAGLVGNVWIRSEDYTLMAALPMEAPGAVSFSFPQLAQAQGYWTGMSLANPGATPVTVTVEALDASGTSLGTRSFPALAPGENQVGLIYQWIAGTLGYSSGRIEVRASAPVFATEIFGSDRLWFMAAVPGR